MSKVTRIDKKLSALDKPSLLPTDVVGLGYDDVLIFCAGFEDRAISALNFAIASGAKGFSLLVIEYLPVVVENKTEQIRNRCNTEKIPVQYLQYDRQNPAGIEKELLYLLETMKGRIFIDISGMSRLLIVQVLTALGRRPIGFSKTTVLYTMAQHYPPPEQEVENAIAKMEEDPLYSAMFLSSGVFEVSIVPELSSVALQGQPIRLVAFPSFNPNQLAALRAEIQPSTYTLIHGIPPLEENKWRPNKIRILNRTEEILPREDHEVSTLEYAETLKLLLDIYENYGVMEKIVVAPTGSKMQTVAVGILRAFMEDIQVVYPTPSIFPKPKEYTTGARKLYHLSLDSFADIKKY